MLCCATNGKCRDRSCFSNNNNINHNNNNSINNINNNNDEDGIIISPYLIFDNYSEMKRAYADDCSSATTDTAAAPAKIAHHNKAFNINKLPSATEFIKSTKGQSTPEVFLGGSCNPTTWRQDIAVPTFKNLGITYFNPQVSNWEPELIEIEHRAKTDAQVLFYVLDNQTRCTVTMIEVAYLVAKKRKVILVVSGFKGPGQKIMDEPITQTEYEELTRSTDCLSDLVERHGIPVFNDIQTALQCTAKVIRENIRPQDLKITDLEQPIQNRLQNSSLKLWICSSLKKTFDTLDTSKKGEISLADFRRAYGILTHRELTREEVLDVLEGIKNVDKDHNNSPSNNSNSTPRPSSLITDEHSPPLKKESNSNSNGVNGTMLNFEQFCCIMAELIYHHHRRNNNQSRSWSNQLANKASYFVKNISLALTRLLDNVPGSKPGWIPLSSKPEPESKNLHDVYLGGPISSDNSWRSDIAIPILKKHGLTSLNPENQLPIDISGLEKCRVLFFYLPNSSRSLESSVTAVYYIGLGYKVVLCVENLPTEGCQIEGEKLSQIAVKDYNRGRAYLSDMAKREKIPVYDDLQEALQAVVEKCN